MVALPEFAMNKVPFPSEAMPLGEVRVPEVRGEGVRNSAAGDCAREPSVAVA